MAPKKPANKKADDKKGKSGKSADGDDRLSKGKGALKAATTVNVRHILCEKRSRIDEALQKIQEGQAFHKVAQEYSEDKAKGRFPFSLLKLVFLQIGWQLGEVWDGCPGEAWSIFQYRSFRIVIND
ncbi:hypothetical protein D9757_004166 [Collybiopsis confluens]|uniref:peptidylprolyl isomerase n=1 Tax=Collybiopsis confluens TaxID=2823264 RepID=A0A8H5HU89_9AGAR|nr:hypothetical protein D9757_004166 [Collybiopsis confluens]